MALELKWCLGYQAVPLEFKTMLFVNLHQLEDEWVVEHHDEDFGWQCLKLHATIKEVLWLQRNLNLPTKWWVLNCHRIPLLLEMAEQIREAKPKGNKVADQYKREPNVVVAIKLRGKVLFVRNLTTSLTLCFHPDQDLKTDLMWFIQELKREIEVLREAPPPAGPSQKKKRSKKASDFPEEQEMIEALLTKLGDHPNCKTAHHLPSRMSLKVKRKDRVTKEFNFKSYRAKREKALLKSDFQNIETLQSMFDETIGEAMAFLEGKEKPSSSGSSARAKSRTKRKEEEPPTSQEPQRSQDEEEEEEEEKEGEDEEEEE